MSGEKVETVLELIDYNNYLEEVRRAIDVELLNLTSKIADLRLREKIKYVLQTQGKRLRPILVLLSAQSVGGNADNVKKLALAIELLHSATLIHDDILDQDLFRRNAPTANAKWGVRDAVLVGDALASISLHMAAEYDKEIIGIFSNTCLLLSDGEYMDLEKPMKVRSEIDYLEMIRKKSASLFKAATECGAIAARAPRQEIDALGRFGENFGLAYQVKDDLSDVLPTEDFLPQDINEFRVTLPIIHLCKSLRPTERYSMLKAIASMKTQSPAENKSTLNKLRKSLEITGSVNYCMNKINQHSDAAVASLEPLKQSVYKDYLIRTANLLKLRLARAASTALILEK